MDLDFSEDEIARYSRHILLAEIGGTGQARLRAARVLVVGAGGLGSPLALYLAAAGVGTIGLVDDDRVELSNLQRQIAHTMASLGRPKVESAAAAIAALNPATVVRTHDTRLDAGNALALVADYDLVCDGSDNFATRFLLADACVLARRTLVSAAVLRFEGQLSTFKPHADPDGPCYRCLHPAPPPPGLVPACSEAGVMGAVTGVMGTLQATEVVKEIVGIGEGLSGRLLVWDALAVRFRTVRLRRDPDCALCSPHATIRSLDAIPARCRRARMSPDPLALLLLSGSQERAHYAFVLAAGGAALGRPVVLFATNRGCLALCRDWSALDDAARDAVVRARGVAGLSELREAAAELGVRLIACEAGLLAEGIAREDLLGVVEVAGVATFLEAAGRGQIVSL